MRVCTGEECALRGCALGKSERVCTRECALGKSVRVFTERVCTGEECALRGCALGKSVRVCTRECALRECALGKGSESCLQTQLELLWTISHRQSHLLVGFLLHKTANGDPSCTFLGIKHYWFII